jgi:hypothetical protein
VRRDLISPRRAHARLRRGVPAAAQTGPWCIAEAAIMAHSLTGAHMFDEPSHAKVAQGVHP